MTKTEEYLDKLHDARQSLRDARTSHFKHHKGGVYRVEDFVISKTDKQAWAVLARVDGPGFDVYQESEIAFVEPLTELFDTAHYIPVKHVSKSEWVHNDA